MSSIVRAALAATAMATSAVLLTAPAAAASPGASAATGPATAEATAPPKCPPGQHRLITKYPHVKVWNKPGGRRVIARHSGIVCSTRTAHAPNGVPYVNRAGRGGWIWDGNVQPY